MPMTVKYTPMHCKVLGHRASGKYIDDPDNPRFETPPDPPVVIDEEATFMTEIRNSYNSPAWGVAKTRYYRYARRKPLKARPPVQPSYRPPRRPVYPTRRIGASDRSWERALRKYGAKLADWQRRKDAYDLKYNQAYNRFVQKTESYNAMVIAHASRSLSVVKKAAGVQTNSINNPYQFTREIDTNWEFNFRYRQLRRRENVHTKEFPIWRFYPDVNGDQVVFEEAWYGNSNSSLTGYCPVLPSAPFSGPLINEANAKCVSQLYEKLGDQQVHVGNMIAERAQTYETLVRACLALKEFLHSPKQQVLSFITSGIGSASKKASNALLSYCFGIEPFANDIYNSAKALVRLSQQTEAADMVKVRAGGSSKKEDVFTFDFGYYEDIVTVKTEVRVRYMCEYRIDNRVFSSLSAMGLVDPRQIAWEVMPWSFVIDWFYPVGDMLASLTADSGLSFRAGTTSTWVRTTRSVRRKFKPHPATDAGGHQYVGEISRTVVQEHKSRSVLNGPPVRSLPRVKNPFSIRHIVLSLALWRQRA